MATATINTGTFALYSVQPCTDEQEPLSFSGTALLSAAINSTLLDLTGDSRFGDRKFSPVRIWVDNSASGISLTILVQGTGQLIVVKPATQGIYPLLAQDSESGANFKCTISGVPAGLVSIPIQIMNVPVTPFVWATA